MLSLVKRILTNELISGASFVFFGGLMASVLNFFFNLFMTRNLPLADYGTLASLISLITLSTLPTGAILPTFIFFFASYLAKGEVDMVRGLFLRFTKLLATIGILAFVIYVVFKHQIASFLKIDEELLIVVVGAVVAIGFIGIANLALLQAKLAFKFFSFINFLSALAKLGFGTTFVLLGFRVGGAMWAIFIASLVPYALSFLPLKFVFKHGIKIPKVSLGRVLSFAAPSSLALFSTTSFITTDIILIKHFWEPVEAGVYATLSLIGRVIYFFSAPIATVMFPLVVKKHTRQEDFHTIFLLAFCLVLIPSIGLTIFYFLFPHFVIQFFSKNEEALRAAPFVGIFGVFITAYSLLWLLVNLYLSIKKTNVCIPIVIGAASQAVLLWFYHKTFFQVILISLGITSLLLMSLLLYYWILYGKRDT